MNKKPWFHTACCVLIFVAGCLYPFTGETPPAWLISALIGFIAVLLALPMWQIWAFQEYRDAVDEYLAVLEQE